MPARSLDPERAFAADISACRRLLRGGSRTFFAASLLLPRRVRDPASALYAFCRLADDAVDLDRQAGAGSIARLRQRLQRVYAGCPEDRPADRALARVVRQFDIPMALPEGLLEGLTWDLEGRRYDDFDGVCAYGARVAGTVGAMMSLIMGARSEQALARATDLGVAMQLSNIARDVGEDARAGRIYLPLAWLQAAGLDVDQWLSAPQFEPAIAAAVERLLREADRLYLRAGYGVGLLPPSCRPAIHAARLMYAAIGHEVAARQFDSISARAVVPVGRKARLLAQACAAAARPAARLDAPPLAQNRFLISAVPPASMQRSMPRSSGARQGLEGRAIFLIDLFERLERREHVGRSG